MEVFFKNDGHIRPASEIAVTQRSRDGSWATDFDLFFPPCTEPKRIMVGLLIHFDRFSLIHIESGIKDSVIVDNEYFSGRIRVPGFVAMWAGPLDRHPSTAFRGNHTNFEYSGENATLAFSWPEFDFLLGSAKHLTFSVEEPHIPESEDIPGWVPPVMIIGLMIPNLIVALVCQCRRGTSAPVFTFVASLALNAGHACLILTFVFGLEDFRLGFWICDGTWLLILLCGGTCKNSGACVVCKHLRL
jgi:hypothetical protein